MNVRFCGKTPFPIDSCGMHTHKHWEIVYQLSGENISRIGKKTFNVVPGVIMIIPPGGLHDGNSGAVYTDMYIQAANLDFCDIGFVHDYDGSICELFNMVHKSFSQKDGNYSNICDTVLEAICQYIKKYISVHYKHTFVYELENYIYENISNAEFKVAELSAYAGYNIDYIRRSFFEETGKTPREYLMYLRLSLAKKLLLQETFLSIEDVAEKCGFADSFYFSTLFRKKTGMTPSMYKKTKQDDII